MRALFNRCVSLFFATCFCLSSAWAQTFTFAAIGDVPYGPVDDLAQLVDKLNQKPIAFTIHVGDIKSGGSLCTDKIFLDVKAQFDRFDQPLIYTPGDNEWTDCHRFSNGSYDPLERLEKIRSLFFSQPQSLGKRPIAMLTQSAQPNFSRFVENRRWVFGRVSFATLHLVGSNNNFQPELASSIEFAARNEANIAWMRETFAKAKDRGDIAVVLAMQADTFYGNTSKTDSGFTKWLSAFEIEARAWNKPVLLIQGDTHNFTVDHPLKNADGKVLTNVTRLVVHGALHVNGSLIDVNESNLLEPFTLRTLITAN
jgi:hypothetical protein